MPGRGLGELGQSKSHIAVASVGIDETAECDGRSVAELGGAAVGPGGFPEAAREHKCVAQEPTSQRTIGRERHGLTVEGDRALGLSQTDKSVAQQSTGLELKGSLLDSSPQGPDRGLDLTLVEQGSAQAQLTDERLRLEGEATACLGRGLGPAPEGKEAACELEARGSAPGSPLNGSPQEGNGLTVAAGGASHACQAALGGWGDLRNGCKLAKDGRGLGSSADEDQCVRQGESRARMGGEEPDGKGGLLEGRIGVAGLLVKRDEVEVGSRIEAVRADRPPVGPQSLMELSRSGVCGAQVVVVSGGRVAPAGEAEVGDGLTRVALPVGEHAEAVVSFGEAGVALEGEAVKAACAVAVARLEFAASGSGQLARSSLCPLVLGPATAAQGQRSKHGRGRPQGKQVRAAASPRDAETEWDGHGLIFDLREERKLSPST